MESDILKLAMDGSAFKQRQHDHSTTFSRDTPHQSIAPPPGLTDRHVKTSTAPPTGSPTLAPKTSHRHRPEDDILVQPLTQSGYPEAPRANNPTVLPQPTPSAPAKAPTTGLNDLPIEIHDAVIDHLAGAMGSSSSPNSYRLRTNWGKEYRHPRRKDLSDLALVSRIWRRLIQERLYRHIKIKGTRSELQTCGDWFLTHPSFQTYVKHVEIWVPLFEVPVEKPPRLLLSALPSPQYNSHTTAGPHVSYSESVPTTPRVSRTLDNATLEEIYSCSKVLFPEACALTIEGGHCKKSRKVQHFRTNSSDFCVQRVAKAAAETPQTADLQLHRRFPEHPKVSTLILKGSWNIIRCAADFQYLAVALPSIREWHCVYAKPKTDAYKAMCGALRSLPATITRVNLCLEGLNGKQPSTLSKWRKLFPEFHVCRDLGRILPQLESLAYSGHICNLFFKSANATAAVRRDKSRLRSLDLFVRNVCRDSTEIDEFPPCIYNWPFIQAFENLVLEAIASLDYHPDLEYVRIRFLDLDCPRPLVLPYWHYENNTSTGVWSTKILAALDASRRKPSYSITADVDLFRGLAAGLTSSARPKSLHIEEYEALARVG